MNLEPLYALLLKDAAHTIFIADGSARTTSGNASGYRLTGCPKEDLPGRNFTGYISPHGLAHEPLPFDEPRTGRPLIGGRLSIRKYGPAVLIGKNAKMQPDDDIHGIPRGLSARKTAAYGLETQASVSAKRRLI